MEISKNIAANIRQYKQERDLSVLELAEELHLAASSTQEYLSGNSNPRADTLELLAQRMGLTVADLISGPSAGWEQSVLAMRAARKLGNLPAAQREEAIQAFLTLVRIFAGEE